MQAQRIVRAVELAQQRREPNRIRTVAHTAQRSQSKRVATVTFLQLPCDQLVGEVAQRLERRRVHVGPLARPMERFEQRGADAPRVGLRQLLEFGAEREGPERGCGRGPYVALLVPGHQRQKPIEQPLRVGERLEQCQLLPLGKGCPGRAEARQLFGVQIRQSGEVRAGRPSAGRRVGQSLFEFVVHHYRGTITLIRPSKQRAAFAVLATDDTGPAI